ncbi:hypothetical protein JANAI62_21200 [Jannaschia pagri]|uniref:DUF2459 domain-containing protein n=1 Tax=Jannaschia pagri TaxID=2829797 RepID=A0ABQ4NM56_9RHOB|nr:MULTISPECIES: DUF2459 domain-containing protein [unclassified Jannaschia]GIT91663.1 hypothetical protein JANAI61_21210 [Jannaschia sp. AI_61]GIT95497.1 hypothetical protein JANAI62_21200 [Jannaschia sp. AI_62]
MFARRLTHSALRGTRWLLLIPFVCLLWLGAGFGGALWTAPGEDPGDDVDIHFIGTAIHVDLLLPATPEVRAALDFAAEDGVPLGAADWVLVGWGARDFYTATGSYSDMRIGPVWRAVTGDASVLRIEVYGPINTAGLDRLSLSHAQFMRLVQAIADTRGGPVLPSAGFTSTDRFYEARGRFHIFRTCNVWVGEMLRAAGLRFGRWTPTPQAFRLALRHLTAT